MKIAHNYLMETEELVKDRVIDIDYFKFPALGSQMGSMENIDLFSDFCQRITSQKPILLHGLYPAPHDLASPTLIESFDYELVSKMIEITKTPGISIHPSLGPVISDLPFDNLVKSIIKNIQFLKEHYSHLDFVSVENLDSLRYGQLIDPKVITEIIKESDCQFLLDISHAYCAARAREENIRDYLRRLPLSKVYEIHINGWAINEKGIMCHIKIHEECYELLKELLVLCKPEIITIEYGRGNDKIGAGIPLVSNNQVNDAVKDEIIEQTQKIRDIINGRM